MDAWSGRDGLHPEGLDANRQGRDGACRTMDCSICGRLTNTGSDHGFCTTHPDRVVKAAAPAA